MNNTNHIMNEKSLRFTMRSLGFSPTVEESIKYWNKFKSGEVGKKEEGNFENVCFENSAFGLGVRVLLCGILHEMSWIWKGGGGVGCMKQHNMMETFSSEVAQ